VASRIVAMVEGAARELVVGDPRDPETHIGPVIDAAARDGLMAHVEAMRRAGRVSFAGEAAGRRSPGGYWVQPHVIRLDRVGDLAREVFGPILHVVTWRAAALPALLDELAATGYGLTLGIHSRVERTTAAVLGRLRTGNVYVNRNMIGAVVGTQPFGGFGLSGTGPKAGGPDYLRRFTTEQVVSVNTAATGGNASLLALEED
jgi:RHH-type proline utilization regulon transcriptional repressor/proline dehydrogenase/delta 1-pyrroline-5-carboxylate dehydrogenase